MSIHSSDDIYPRNAGVGTAAMGANPSDKELSVNGTAPLPTSLVPIQSLAPPNGGFEAWLQVAGAFFLYFNSWWDSSTVLLRKMLIKY
jgi:hypothetical protein